MEALCARAAIQAKLDAGEELTQADKDTFLAAQLDHLTYESKRKWPAGRECGCYLCPLLCKQQ